MTSDERSESLADQAAAWVPPWARNTTPAGQAAPPADSQPPPPVDDAQAETGGEPRPDQDSPVVVAPATGPTEPAASAPEPVPVSSALTEPARVPASPAAGAPAVRRDDKLALLDEAELHGALEAILLVVDEPASEQVLAQVLEQPTDRVRAALQALAGEYTRDGRGFELRRAAGGWRLYTRPEYASYVERFVLDGQSVRLTQAALETLAVVAYKQPVTRSRISAIRGVNCDGVIRTLLSRGLVQECGVEPDSGAHLYQTSTLFLEKLGIDSVDELPPLAPFLPDDVEEIADASR